MALRFGFGPVFSYEWLTTSRRWQMYAGRSVFVAILLTALSLVWGAHLKDDPYPTHRSLAKIGEMFFYAIIGTQLALVLLAAPAATAGTICLDKACGALVHLLVTDLSDAEIVLGKLAARLVPVLGLLACAVPVMFLGVLLGGIAPDALVGAFLVTLGAAVFGCALALTLSVWGTRPYEVVLASYAIWVGLLLANPIWYFLDWTWKIGSAPDWYRLMDPFALALAPYLRPGATDWEEPALFLGVALMLSAALVVLAVARIRAVAIRQSSQPQRAPRQRRAFWRPTSWLPGPSLDGNPVLWREWHRKRPSRWTLLIWVIYGLLTSVFTMMEIFRDNLAHAGEAAFTNALQVSIGLLLLSVGAVTALAEERVRGSLDVLLATPLSTFSIVWGKWWGAFRPVPFLVVLPAVLTFRLAMANGEWYGPLLIIGEILAYGAAVTSLGLALATWIARMGRAIALSVVVYVLITVGGLMALLVLTPMHGYPATGLALGSPFFGPGQLTADMAGYQPSPDRAHCFGWTAIWIVVYTCLALALWLAVLGTFDRCLGRIGNRKPLARVIREQEKRKRKAASGL